MRILLDECLPRTLAPLFGEHECGWAGTKNGALLALAAEEFDLFVTVDHGLRFQQNLDDSGLAVAILVAPSNRVERLAPLVPIVLSAIESMAPGDVRVFELRED